MDRHWRELERARLRRQADGTKNPILDIRCPLGAPPERTRRAGRWRRAWEKYFAYPRLVRRSAATVEADIVHVLDHSFAHLLPAAEAATTRQRGPGHTPFKIVTVHDLAPLRDGSDLSRSQRERFRRTVGHVRQADLVLADSRHSADDAVRLLGVMENKVRVLPLGVDVARFAESPPPGVPPPAWLERLPAGRRVVLSVGVAAPRKNLGLLPAVFRELVTTATAGPPVCLLRVGETLPDALRAELTATLGPEGLVELGAASDDDLRGAYQRADALLFPSRLEGFGFPLLEAMAAGCPVVSSDASSLTEVGGDAALYFAPDNPRGAAVHLRHLFTDEAHRHQQIALGQARVTEFSWERHLHALVTVYLDVGLFAST